jgi:hypothetical protein
MQYYDVIIYEFCLVHIIFLIFTMFLHDTCTEVYYSVGILEIIAVSIFMGKLSQCAVVVN